jgi:hypothetical protein
MVFSPLPSPFVSQQAQSFPLPTALIGATVPGSPSGLFLQLPPVVFLNPFGVAPSGVVII